ERLAHRHPHVRTLHHLRLGCAAHKAEHGHHCDDHARAHATSGGTQNDYRPKTKFPPGIASSRSFVYCSRGLSNTSSVVAASTIWPFFMTQTLSATRRTTARSCVMNR